LHRRGIGGVSATVGRVLGPDAQVGPQGARFAVIALMLCARALMRSRQGSSQAEIRAPNPP